jgi:predicted DNA-binding antitoxin AbrB/MazE fold protein
MEMITAIYENGVFKPLRPVQWPEGTPVRVEAEYPKADREADLRELLLSKGATPEEAEKILANLRLLWESYDTLTPEQKKVLEESRFDQVHFFDRQADPKKP